LLWGFWNGLSLLQLAASLVNWTCNPEDWPLGEMKLCGIRWILCVVLVL
jgi:hypothetical protein